MALYLAKMNLKRSDPLLPVDQLTQFIRSAVLPSVESLTRLQAQGKVVYGGYPVGRPAIVLLVDAHSEEELYEILESLPLWEQVEVEITRMQGFEELVSLDETAEP
jgi:muconolactone delta-isomerase